MNRDLIEYEVMLEIEEIEERRAIDSYNMSREERAAEEYEAYLEAQHLTDPIDAQYTIEREARAIVEARHAVPPPPVEDGELPY